MKIITAIMAVALTAAAPALAAGPQSPCATVVDDQRGLVETTTGEPWRDLRTATLGSDRRNVTVVLALGALPDAPARPEHAAVDYTMRFTVGDATAFLTAPAHAQSPASYGVEIGHRPVVLGEARVVRDVRGKQLRITAPLAAFAPLAELPQGATATNLSAHVALSPGAGRTPTMARAQTVIVDGLHGLATHRIGSGSCATGGDAPR